MKLVSTTMIFKEQGMYNLKPENIVKKYELALEGNNSIGEYLNREIEKISSKDKMIVFELYPGTNIQEFERNLLSKIEFDNKILSDDYFIDAKDTNEKIKDNITDDRVLGVMSHYNFKDFLKEDASLDLDSLKGTTVVYGTGASVVSPQNDLLIYGDLARWEIQLRYRAGMANWHQANEDEDQLRKFKRGYFFDWRVADKQKEKLFSKIDFILDTNENNNPKLISGEDFRNALTSLTKKPFRTVPYFDESVWGGQWMKEHFGLPENNSNYGWAFDGVPEENSLLFKFGDVRVELPAMDLIMLKPKQLLGSKVYARFGAEFPIRFDYLDTMGGGNLSLQVHPLSDYAFKKYGMKYTQDESYYILDAKKDSSVYLGFKDDVDKTELGEDLAKAQESGKGFDAEKYVNKLPAKKHDHFIIPAGTIHCSGSDTVVLEISATPYIFTFKMWDWDRLGLDGRPRPVHLVDGMNNIQLDRNTDWVKKELVNNFSKLVDNEDEIVERTGLHETLEFIETHRHVIKTEGHFETHGSVNMLNMVEGNTAVVTSPENSFEDYVINYGETFIVPSEVKEYRIKSLDENEISVVQAYVR